MAESDPFAEAAASLDRRVVRSFLLPVDKQEGFVFAPSASRTLCGSIVRHDMNVWGRVPDVRVTEGPPLSVPIKGRTRDGLNYEIAPYREVRLQTPEAYLHLLEPGDGLVVSDVHGYYSYSNDDGDVSGEQRPPRGQEPDPDNASTAAVRVLRWDGRWGRPPAPSFFSFLTWWR